MLYRYFIYYEASLRNGSLCHKNVFLELDKELNNEKVLKQVENFLMSQNTDISNLIIVNFNLVGIFEKDQEVKNG